MFTMKNGLEKRISNVHTEQLISDSCFITRNQIVFIFIPLYLKPTDINLVQNQSEKNK